MSFIDSSGVGPEGLYSRDWALACDIDFTTLSNQTLSSNGNYTVGGYTWVKQNSSNDNVAMSVTNGSGLIIQPKAGNADYNGATRNIPLLCLPLTNAIPGFDMLRVAARAWIYVSASNYTANYDSVVLSIDIESTDMGYVAKNGYNTSGQGQGRYLGVNGVNVNGFSNTTTNVTDNVLCVEATMGLLGCHLRSYSGTYSSGWPAVSAMHINPIITVSGNLATGGVGADTWAACIGAQRFASATALSVTVARFKLEYRYK